MVEEGIIADGVAPSYFVEGLLYNVPHDQFGQNYADSFCNCFNWILSSDKSKWICTNNMHFLLGTTNVQWTRANCDLFINGLANLWNNWR